MQADETKYSEIQCRIVLYNALKYKMNQAIIS